MPLNARTDTQPILPEVSVSNPYAFPPTQWSVVAKAVSCATPGGREALNTICERYWLPLYAYARRAGCTPHDAEDITQGYIYSILKRNSLASVVKEKGRLRSFLLTGLKNHLISEFRKESSEKRSADKLIPGNPLDHAEQVLAEDNAAYASAPESPAEVFDRRWALALLDQVLQRLRQEYEARDELQVFNLLCVHLNGKEGSNDGAYEAIATTLRITPNLVRVRVHRMKRKYRQLLLQEIAATVPRDEIELELKYLFSVFQR